MPFKALILAAGFGVRLREIVHGRPKHLVSINAKPFLRHLTEMLSRRGVDDLVIAVGYLAQAIKDEYSRNLENIKVSFSEDDRPLGTAGSLKNSQKFFKEDFLVINGDTYLDLDYLKLVEWHRQKKALLTLVGTSQHKDKGGVIIAAGNKITKFIVKPEAKPSAKSLRHAGVYVMSAKIFNFIPRGQKYSIEKELLPDLISKRQPVYVFTTNREFIDIGSPESLKRASQVLTCLPTRQE